MTDFFCLCYESFIWYDAEFCMPSRDSNHYGERTDNLSCIRQNNENGRLGYA